MTAQYLVVALIVFLPMPVSASADLPSCTGDNVESYEVTATAARSSYRIGQTAVVHLHVTDSVTGMPAGDVDTGIAVEGRGKRMLMDASKTDDDGEAVVQVDLRRRHVEPGWAEALAVAWQAINTPVYCTGRSGYRSYPKLFRIRG